MSGMNGGFYTLADPKTDTMRYGPLELVTLQAAIKQGKIASFPIESDDWHIVAISPAVPYGHQAIVTMLAQPKLTPNGDTDEDGQS